MYKRKSIRLQEYDYSQTGYYYVTICTLDRTRLFGRIIDNKVVLNKYGLIAQNEWVKTPDLRPYVKLDEFIIMPDHIHMIIIIDKCCRGVSTYALKNNVTYALKNELNSNDYHSINTNKPINSELDSDVNKIINSMKPINTDVGSDVRAYVDTDVGSDVRAYVDTPLRVLDNTLPRSTSKTVGSIVRGFKSVVTSNINQLRNTPRTKIWQRNYFEHVIRNQKELDKTRSYIKNNPLTSNL